MFIYCKQAYIKNISDHKDSTGKAAPWCVLDHGTGKVLSSHKTKEKAKSHLRNMKIHGSYGFIGLETIEELLKYAVKEDPFGREYGEEDPNIERVLDGIPIEKYYKEEAEEDISEEEIIKLVGFSPEELKSVVERGEEIGAEKIISKIEKEQSVSVEELNYLLNNVYTKEEIIKNLGKELLKQYGIRQLGRILGFPNASDIYNVLQKKEREPLEKGQLRDVRKIDLNNFKSRLQELRNQGYKLQDISKSLGISYDALRNLLIGKTEYATGIMEERFTDLYNIFSNEEKQRIENFINLYREKYKGKKGEDVANYLNLFMSSRGPEDAKNIKEKDIPIMYLLRMLKKEAMRFLSRLSKKEEKEKKEVSKAI